MTGCIRYCRRSGTLALRAPALQQRGKERALQAARRRRLAPHQRGKLAVIPDQHETPRKSQRAQRRGQRQLRRLVQNRQVEEQRLAHVIIALG